MVTNINCGKHTPNKCYRKHISVLDEVIKEGKQKEGLISKTARPTNARKKALATAFQVCHLFLQTLNPRINSINSWLNFLHKEALGNLTKMIQNKLHSKTHTNKLLNRDSPLQDPLGGDSIDKVMLDVVYHAPQHPQEMLSGRTTKAESLHTEPIRRNKGEAATTHQLLLERSHHCLPIPMHGKTTKTFPQ